MTSNFRFWLLFCWVWCTLSGSAQNEYPIITPTAEYKTAEGEMIEDASIAQSAPLAGYFKSNVENSEGYTVRYEWKIYAEGKENAPLIHRFDADMEYTFTKSGTFFVQLYATFIAGTDTIQYPGENEPTSFVVSISESKLEIPNAFSPNGDGINDVYKVKENHQSIVSFRATIFNRWGQKIYTWANLDGGWDGMLHGTVVPDGTYFVVVEARGADGKKYNIKKDVNVLTGYTDNRSNGSNQ